MARNIVVVDSSTSMRRIIRTMIQSAVNDAIVSEAKDCNVAMELVQNDPQNLVLFSKESSDQKWLDFIKKESGKKQESKTHYVVFTSSKNEDFLKEIKQYGVLHHLIIPFSPTSIGDFITEICNPFVMRSSRRYSAPNTTAILAQGAETHCAEVVNFSEGGMLCELEAPSRYAWAAPVMATLEFVIDDEKITADGLFSVISRMIVVASNPDYSPKRIRLAYRFVTVPEESKTALAKAFDNVENLEERFQQ